MYIHVYKKYERVTQFSDKLVDELALALLSFSDPLVYPSNCKMPIRPIRNFHLGKVTPNAFSP